MFRAMINFSKTFLFILCVGLVLNLAVYSQTTAFTYQGNLNDNGQPANGNYDFEFALFDSLSGGNQVGTTITRFGVNVTDGVFSVILDFGPAFSGANRFMEIRVGQGRLSEESENNSATGGFTTLSPRQGVNSSPYAIKSLTSNNAANADQLGGINANQFVLSNDSRLSDSRMPTAGSSNYIQNGTTEQSSSNFKISGTGSADIFDVSTQYSIGGIRVLTIPGIDNTFLGDSAGTSNTTGERNSFFGKSAGTQNTDGQNNSFFGDKAGMSNTTGSANSFFGASAGDRNDGGGANVFFGQITGFNNTSGSFNTFLGRASGTSNSVGNNNTYVGYESGEIGTTGNDNTFVGFEAGDANTTGSNNTLVGGSSDVSTGDLTYATAVGSDAVVETSNTIQLGRNGTDIVRIGVLSPTSGVIDVCLNSNRELTTCNDTARSNSANYQEQDKKVENLQKQIEQQKAQIKKQQTELDALKQLVCSTNKEAEVCKAKK